MSEARSLADELGLEHAVIRRVETREPLLERRVAQRRAQGRQAFGRHAPDHPARLNAARIGVIGDGLRIDVVGRAVQVDDVARDARGEQGRPDARRARVELVDVEVAVAQHDLARDHDLVPHRLRNGEPGVRYLHQHRRLPAWRGLCEREDLHPSAEPKRVAPMLVRATS
jgi:hypothetical protein